GTSQFCFEGTLNVGPIRVNDAEECDVFWLAILIDRVASQDSFMFGPTAQHGLARTIVNAVDDKLYTCATELFEGMAQHQVLGFGVNKCALPIASNPGVPYDKSAIGSVQTVVA